MPSELKPCSKCGWEHHPTFKCWGDITDALGTRCTLCGTAAPSSLWRECDRPECPHRPEPATPATQKGAWSKNVSLASSAYPPATQADDVTGLVERLQHCSQNTKDEYLHELTGRAADAITALTRQLGERDAENKRLRAVVVRYGDRIRMAMAPAELQQTIDEALGGDNG